MCKETFLRLPVEKRTRFLDAAWAEFTKVKFADVSINQIVQRAGVPRGSFYQYFEDKEDLFHYLLQEIRESFLRTYRQMVQQAKGDIFQAQVLCYDQFLQKDGTGLLLDRCVQLMRLNPEMDVRLLMQERRDDSLPDERPEGLLLAEVWDQLDLTALRRQDRAFVGQLFSVSLQLLGAAIRDTLVRPERIENCRNDLLERIEIIKYGSLRVDSPSC